MVALARFALVALLLAATALAGADVRDTAALQEAQKQEQIDRALRRVLSEDGVQEYNTLM
jgi:hypothetical protein